MNDEIGRRQLQSGFQSGLNNIHPVQGDGVERQQFIGFRVTLFEGQAALYALDRVLELLLLK